MGQQATLTLTISDTDVPPVSLTIADPNLPLDDNYDVGNLAQQPESVTYNGTTYTVQTLQPVRDNGLDRNRSDNAGLNSTPPYSNNPDLHAATLVVGSGSGAALVGTLTWTIPDGIKVWWQQAGRWVERPE